MNKLNTMFVLLLMLTTLSSCGDLFGKKVTKKNLGASSQQANCELDMDRFSKIIKENISPTINCLKKNLDIFIKMSELSQGNKLSQKALIAYLKRNRPDTTPKTISIVNSIFALGSLITGEEKGFISKENVQLIVDMVKTFNIHSARHYESTFGSDAPATLYVHNTHRALVAESADEIRKVFKQIFVTNRGSEIHFVDTMDILRGFIKDNGSALEKIEGILFLKKILLGGDITTITHTELGFLFDHLPDILPLVLDGVRFKHLDLEQKELMTFIKEDTASIMNILFHPRRGTARLQESFFEIDMAIEGIDRFIPKEEDKIGKYRKLIQEGMRVLTYKKENELMSIEKGKWINGENLETIFNHIYNVTDRVQDFHRFYNFPKIKALVESSMSVDLNWEDYKNDFPNDRVSFTEFARIITDYRYMKGGSDMATYSLEYARDAKGIGEIAMLEYGIKTFFRSYEMTSATVVQLQEIVKKFEEDLIEMDVFLPHRAASTAETITLLGSLFQAQSDQNAELDVNEATEFAIALFTAMDAKKKIFAFYDNTTCEKDDFGRVDPVCFKDHFIEALCTSYRPYLPRLFEYFGAPAGDCKQNFNSVHNLTYINASAEAARTCQFYPAKQPTPADPKPVRVEVPYSEGDVMSMVLAMMHIETTITRWDNNFNNKMDPVELINSGDKVLDAWDIYRPAIFGMLPPVTQNLPEKLKEFLGQTVFQYLVKFESQPKTDGANAAKTILNLTKLIGRNNKVPATRKTIASILRVVGEESRKKVQAAYDANPNDPNVEKPFKCECLEDMDPVRLRICLDSP